MWTDVDNTGFNLLPGQYCRATVTMSILKDSITIPSEALVQQASDQYVWLVGSDETVTQTKGRGRTFARRNCSAQVWAKGW